MVVIGLADRLVEKPNCSLAISWERMLEEVLLYNHILVGDIHISICFENFLKILRGVNDGKNKRDVILGGLLLEGIPFLRRDGLLFGEEEILQSLRGFFRHGLEDNPQRKYDYRKTANVLLECGFLGDNGFKVYNFSIINEGRVAKRMSLSGRSLVYVGNGHLRGISRYPIGDSFVFIYQKRSNRNDEYIVRNAANEFILYFKEKKD